MKMRKFIAFFIAAFIIISILPLNTAASSALNVGDVLGYTLNTDIKVYIDGCQIPSYCINNKMVINMDDLSNYGFDVVYDNKAREMRAYRNVGKEFDPVDNPGEAGFVSLPYLHTDIKTYIDYREIEKFSINGNVFICVDDLGSYGKFVWDNDANILKLTLSDMSDKTPTKFEFKKASLNTLSESNNDLVLTGFSVEFTGTHYYINPDDFTELILTKNGERVDNKIINYEPAQLKFENNTTTAVFTFNENVTESGVYKISGKYKNMSFESDKQMAEPYFDENTPVNPSDLNKVVIFSETNNNRITTLSNKIGFYFDGKQGAFNISDLKDLKLTVNKQKIEFSLNNGDVQREVKYSEETNTYTTVYYINLEDYTFAYGTYVLSGKYMGKSFTSNETTVKTMTGTIPASVVFSANADGILTKDDVIRQLRDNGLSIQSEFVANFDSSVKTLERWAFSRCTGLVALNFSENISEMGTLVFDDCDKLQIINVHKNNQYFTVSDNVLFNKNKTMLMLCPATRTGAYVIPDGVKTLHPNAFFNCYYLTEIQIPESVTSIGGHSFNACIGLKKLVIPSQVSSIGYGAFAGCTNLKTLTFKGINPPDFINDTAFPEVTTVYIPRVSLVKYENALQDKIPGVVFKTFD